LIALSTLVSTIGVNVVAQDGQYKVSITPRARPSSAQAGPKPSGTLRHNVNLVLIPVLVTDMDDRPVLGLKQENFRLFEDGAEQGISQFFSDDSPISIGLIVDASNSMRTKMSQSRRAVSEFLRMSTPGDDFFLLKFNDHPEVLRGFTTKIEDIEEDVDALQTGGWTSLYDAIYLAINTMKHAKQTRKVLLILSDGGDNNSRYTESEVRQRVKEADVRIFSISILDRSPSLDRISQESGGRAYRVKNLDELPDLAVNINVEMHSQYVLGYTPAARANDGKYRKVKVEVAEQAEGQRLRTSWKRGYYGPMQ